MDMMVQIGAGLIGVAALFGYARWWLSSRDKRVRDEAYKHVENETLKQSAETKKRMDKHTSKRDTPKQTRKKLRDGSF